MNDTQKPIARLSDFVVTERPLSASRNAKFKPVTGSWWKNPKLRHAAERTLDTTEDGKLLRNQYVEDGDTNFKVRFEPSEAAV